jgi:glycine/D-amino acid oxidase-like deaminating enzyme
MVLYRSELNRISVQPELGLLADAGVKFKATNPAQALTISRLGNRVRVAGCSVIGGSDSQKNVTALTTLYKVLQDWFLGATHLLKGDPEWRGVQGIWLNLGHGASGWALSYGSAHLVADQIREANPMLMLPGFPLTAQSLGGLNV